MSPRDIDKEVDRSRTENELIEAENEFFNKVWYVRHQIRKAENGKVSTSPSICRDAESKAHLVQEMYGNVQEWFPRNDYELGYLHGTFGAVRWALGYKWGFLDT